MKALLIEYGKGHHPQATRQVRKTEADNCFAEGQFGDQKQAALFPVTGGCLPCIFVSSQKYTLTSSVGRHFIEKTILSKAMKSLCGKLREHPKTFTARTSLLNDERLKNVCFRIATEQQVRFLTKKANDYRIRWSEYS